jgi:hypothetical protein
MWQTKVVETTKGFLCPAQFVRTCYGLWGYDTNMATLGSLVTALSGVSPVRLIVLPPVR